MKAASSLDLDYGVGVRIDGIPFPFHVGLDVTIEPDPDTRWTTVTLPVFVDGIVTITGENGKTKTIDPIEGDVGEWARRIVREGLVEAFPWLRLDWPILDQPASDGDAVMGGQRIAKEAAVKAEVRGARAVLAAVEALHGPWPGGEDGCRECDYPCPCPTLTAAREAVAKIEADQ